MGWLESAVAEVLQKSLGAYVIGIDSKALDLDLSRGDVRLKNLELRTEALDSLQLPVQVLGAKLGELHVKVPWNNLGSEPVVVHLDKLFLLLAPPAHDISSRDNKEVAKAASTKREQLDVWETIEKKRAASIEHIGGGSVIESLRRVMLQKLEFSVTNVHVRLVSEAVAIGAVIQSVALSSIEGSEVAASASTPRELVSLFVRKALVFDDLAVYVDDEWHGGTGTEGGAGFKADGSAVSGFSAPTDTAEWDALMMPAISAGAGPTSLLKPLSGTLHAVADPSCEVDSRWPKLSLSLRINNSVDLEVRRSQYTSLIRLADHLARSRKQQSLGGRPHHPPDENRGNAAAWWGYARQAVISQSRLRDEAMLTFHQIQRRRAQRASYLRAYGSFLASAFSITTTPRRAVLEALEATMPISLIVQYRSLARSISKELPRVKWWEASQGSSQSMAHHSRLASEGNPMSSLHKLCKVLPDVLVRCVAPLGRETLSGGLNVGLSRGGASAFSIFGMTEVREVAAIFPLLTTHYSLLTTHYSLQARLQELQEALMQTDSAIDHLPIEFVKWTASLQLPSISLCLHDAQASPIFRLNLREIEMSANMRPKVNGMRVKVQVGSAAADDLSTPWDELMNPIRSVGDSRWLDLEVQTEPLRSDDALQFTCDVQPLRMVANPRLAGALLDFVRIPAKDWCAAVVVQDISRGVIAQMVLLLRAAAFRKWRRRPITIRATIFPPEIVLIEAPPLLSSPTRGGGAVLSAAGTPRLALCAVSLLGDAILVCSQPIAEETGEQAFSVRLGGLRLAIIPATDTPAILSAVLPSRFLAKAETGYQLGPLSATLNAAVLLRPSGANLPLVAVSVDCEPVRLTLQVDQLASVAKVATSAVAAVVSEVEPQTTTGGRCGWLRVTGRQEIQGKSEVAAVGVCWSYLQGRSLVYEEEGSDGTVSPRSVHLSDCLITGSSSPNTFELHSSQAVLGVTYAQSLHLVASSRSEAARWMSACAAMQGAHPHGSTARRGGSTSLYLQAQLQLTAAIPELSISLTGSETQSPPLLWLCMVGLKCGLLSRLRDARAELSVRAFSVDGAVNKNERLCSVPLITTTASERASGLLPQETALQQPAVYLPTPSDFLRLDVAVVAPMSPDYPAARSQFTASVILSPVQVILSAEVAHTLGGVGLRLHEQMQQAAAARQSGSSRVISPVPPIAAVPSSIMSVPPEQFSPLSGEVEWAVPVREAGAGTLRADAVGGGFQEKSIIELQVRATEVALLLYEEPPVGSPTSPSVLPLSELHLCGVQLQLAVQRQSVAGSAHVEGLVVSARELPTVPPVQIISLLLDEGAAPPGAATVGADSQKETVLRLKLKQWEPTAVDFPGHGREVEFDVFPLRMLLPPHLLQRVKECLDRLADFYRNALATMSQQALAAATQALSEAAMTSSEAGLQTRLTARIRGPLIVLPSATVAQAAALLQMADLTVATEAATPERADFAPVERLIVQLSNGKMLIASGSTALDSDYMLRPSYEPHHWLLKDGGLSLTVDRSAGVAGSDVRASLSLTPVVVSLAFSECSFLADLAKESLAAFLPGGDEARPSVGASAVHPSAPVGAFPSSTEYALAESGAEYILAESGVAEVAIPAGVEAVSQTLTLHASIACADGLRVVLLDDSAGTLTPLYELGISSAAASGFLNLGGTQPGSDGTGVEDVPVGSDGSAAALGGGSRGGREEGEGGLTHGSGQMMVQMSAAFYNAGNGYWEPIVEPWEMLGSYAVSCLK